MRQHAWRPVRAACIAMGFLLMALFASSQSGGSYEVTWWSSDGGGGLANGGSYNLISHVGQPDAGAMSGGSYQIMGGYLVNPGLMNSVAVWEMYAE